MLVNRPLFWQEEKDAPLLGRNQSFFQVGNVENTQKILERTTLWKDLAALEDIARNVDWPAPTDIDEQNQRIVVKDAERTFFGSAQRDTVIKLLTAAISRMNDYQQGLGYVTSFLLLTLDEETTLALITKMNEDPRYVPNYWRHEAVAFATDAYVFEHLMEERFPKAAAHLRACFILPETYCQKWFVGLCVHVLPFRELYTFFEHFLERGYPQLFAFGLSLIEHLEPHLLQTKDVSSIYSLLRLDPKLECVTNELTASIIDKAGEIVASLAGIDFALKRQELYDSKLKARMEAAKRSFENESDASSNSSDNDDDDDDDDDKEGSECQICHDMMPELFCKDCQLLVCGQCNEEEKANHSQTHKTIDDWEEIEKLTSSLKTLNL